MAQVERFVGVGRGILYHHQRALVCNGHEAVLVGRVNIGQELYPSFGRDDEVQEAFHNVETGHDVCLLQLFPYFLCHFLWLLARQTYEGEHHEGQMAFELFLSFLQLYLLLVDLLPVERFNRFLHGSDQCCFYFHSDLLIILLYLLANKDSFIGG